MDFPKFGVYQSNYYLKILKKDGLRSWKMKDKNQEDFIWQGETDIYLEKGCWNQRFLWISSMHEVNKTILLDIFRDKQDIVRHFQRSNRIYGTRYSRMEQVKFVEDSP